MIILILIIFTTGMIMGAASASHTFKSKGFEYKMSDKKVKSMKKQAKKYGGSDRYVKVSKVKKWDSVERMKVGKKYHMMTGEKLKVLKLLKYDKGTAVPGSGGYTYKVRIYGTMHCNVEYSNGRYFYNAKTNYR